MQVEPPPEPQPVDEAAGRRKRVPRPRGSHDERMLSKRQRSAAKLGSSSMYMLVACVIGGYFFGIFGVLGCAFLAGAMGVAALLKMRSLPKPGSDDSSGVDRRTARMWKHGRIHAWIGLLGGALVLIATMGLVIAAAAALGSA